YMKTKKVSRQNLRRSSLASFAIEGLKPSDSTLRLADRVLAGDLSREKAISMICEKYKVNTNDT
ncbi:MAG: antitoxin VbhA family protein, partial [Oscillospiraceae bacterium]